MAEILLLAVSHRTIESVLDRVHVAETAGATGLQEKKNKPQNEMFTETNKSARFSLANQKKIFQRIFISPKKFPHLTATLRIKSFIYLFDHTKFSF